MRHLFKRFISIGVMDENTVEFPVLAWRDPTPFAGIDTAGLTAEGSAVFYRYMCALGSTLTDGVCFDDGDCRHLANTACTARRFGNESTVAFQSCQCLAGYQVIPRIRRTFVGGCYDPIVRTRTLLGPCRDQVHCSNLVNTVCEGNPFAEDTEGSGWG